VRSEAGNAGIWATTTIVRHLNDRVLSSPDHHMRTLGVRERLGTVRKDL
jgi:hypothetical protein